MFDPKIRDQLGELRDRFNREPDPKIRDRIAADLNEIEAGFKRIATAKAQSTEIKAGRGPFFSWNAFVLGLGICVALVASFYFGLSKMGMVIVLVLVAFVIVGVQMFLITSRTKKHDDSA